MSWVGLEVLGGETMRRMRRVRVRSGGRNCPSTEGGGQLREIGRRDDTSVS